MITSRSNSKLKNVKKLLESGKARNEQGLFVVEGERLTSEVPEELRQEVYVAESFKKNPFSEYELVADDIFKSLSDTVSPQGIMAVVKQPVYHLSDLLKETEEEKEIVVILDDIRDPGNMGTILRTSEAAGVKGVVMSKGCVDVFNPKVVRSTMGSIFRLPYVKADLKEAITALKEEGFEVYGTSLQESRSYKEVPYGKKVAVIIGNEANGISEEVLALTTANIKIPMKGKVESLNAAVSLAVVLFGI